MNRACIWPLLLGVLAVAWQPCAAADRSTSVRIDRSTDGWPVMEFTLIDQYGDELTRQRLLGQWTFMVFGDTRCAEPCATALSALTALRQRIARAEAVHTTQAVFVSLDPARDTAPRLAAFLAPYDREILAATGPQHMVQELADDLGVSQRIAAAGHDGSLILIGPEGNVRAVYLPPFDTVRLTADYMLKRARRR